MSLQQNITFSVIMPTYKRPVHLRKAVESVLQQTYQNFTLYVIGDCCPHMESVMLQLYDGLSESQKEKVMWHNLEENHGSGGAGPRNWALQNLVTSEWVAYLDDDNWYQPNHLWEAARVIQNAHDNHERISYICTDFEIHDEGKIRIVECNKPCKGRVDTSSVVHRTELIDRYGLWRSQREVGYSNDWDLYRRWIPTEPYACTNKSTMVYNLEFNHQTYDSILSGTS